MCRILVYSGRTIVDPIGKYIKAFIDASENDIYLEKISRFKSHGDGWGIVALGITKGKTTVLYYKSILPIYHQISREIIDLFINRMSRIDEIYLLQHSRLSSVQEPYGEVFTHPFEIRVNKEITLWFIHNGGVDKYALSNEFENVNPILYTDSWIAAMYIGKVLGNCISGVNDVDKCVVEAYEGLRKHTLSALNTGLLILYRDKPFLYASFYHVNYDSLSIDHKNYYTLHYYQGENNALIVSSTVKHYVDVELKPLEQGLYRLEPGKISLIKKY